jgi:hypothetical protein
MKKPSRNLIKSPLSQTYQSEGKEVEIKIYCFDRNEWILEIVNKTGSSKLFEGTFETEQLAFIQFIEDVGRDGIDSFLTEE